MAWPNVGVLLLLSLSVAFGLYERTGWVNEIAARSTEWAEKLQKAAAIAAQDAARTRQLEDEHAIETAKIKEQAHDRDIAIAQAAITTACISSPAMSVLFDGL